MRYLVLLMASMYFTGALAQETLYIYTGPPFTFFSEEPYQPTDRVTGYFALNGPLPPSSTFNLVATIQEFRFFDNVEALDESTGILCMFDVTTDAQGEMADWEFFIRESGIEAMEFQHAIDSFRGSADLGGDAAVAGTNGCGNLALSPSGQSPAFPTGSWVIDTRFFIDGFESP